MKDWLEILGLATIVALLFGLVGLMMGGFFALVALPIKWLLS